MRRSPFGLLPRVAVALALVGLTPLGVLTFRLKDVNRQALEDQVLKTHTVVARNVASRVDAQLAGRKAAVGTVANHSLFLEDPYSAAAGQLLSGLIEAQPGAVAAVLTNHEGEEILRAQLEGQGEVVDRAMAITLATGEEMTTLDGSWLRLDVPLEEERGWLSLVSDLDDLGRAVDTPELGASAQLVLATRDQQVLAGSSQSLEELPATWVEQAASGEIMGARRDLDIAGRSFLAAYAPLDEAPWFVTSLQPSVVAESAAQKLRRQTLLAVFAAALLTGLISAAAYRSLVRPVQKLVQAQRRLAGLEEAPASANELGQLQDTFEVLERRLEHKEALGEVFLDRYEVIEVIGEGAMGTVFRGWDPRLKRAVALKTVKLDKETSEEVRVSLFERLSQEAVLGARLQQGNLVAVYDLVRSGDFGFLAMEFVDGVTLGTYLWQRGGTLPPWEVVYIATAIARGLAAAHSHGVVHHDVKPGNVLLGREGEVKLADFGIARLLSGLSQETSERLFGTPGYLPPETLRGTGYGPRGDLFALGSVMHECLTGELPFQGESVGQLIASTLAGQSGRRVDTWGLIPEDLQRLIESLLCVEADDRPESAGEVAAHLLSLGHYWQKPWAPNLGSSSQGGTPAPTRHGQIFDPVGP